jgi:hypothetical protein
MKWATMRPNGGFLEKKTPLETCPSGHMHSSMCLAFPTSFPSALTGGRAAVLWRSPDNWTVPYLCRICDPHSGGYEEFCPVRLKVFRLVA